MNVKQLKQALALLHIPESVACFDGTRDDDVYRLEGHGDAWAVMYYERGRQLTATFHESEEAACKALLREVWKQAGALVVPIESLPKWLRESAPWL